MQKFCEDAYEVDVEDDGEKKQSGGYLTSPPPIKPTKIKSN